LGSRPQFAVQGLLDSDERGRLVEAVEAVVKRTCRPWDVDAGALGWQALARDPQTRLAEGADEDRVVLQL
jgi:hypothetical protein